MSTRRPASALTGAILMIALLISLTVFIPLTVTAADAGTPITEIEPTPETTKPTTDENGEPLEDFSIVWVTISAVSVVLVASAATAVIFIKKKKGIE